MIVKKNPLLRLPSHPQTHHGASLGYSYTKTCTSTAKDWKPFAVVGTAVTSWREKLEMSYSRSVTTEKVSRLSGFQIHSLFPLSCLFLPLDPLLGAERTVRRQLPAHFELWWQFPPAEALCKIICLLRIYLL